MQTSRGSDRAKSANVFLSIFEDRARAFWPVTAANTSSTTTASNSANISHHPLTSLGRLQGGADVNRILFSRVVELVPRGSYSSGDTLPGWHGSGTAHLRNLSLLSACHRGKLLFWLSVILLGLLACHSLLHMVGMCIGESVTFGPNARGVWPILPDRLHTTRKTVTVWLFYALNLLCAACTRSTQNPGQ
jgi:hypothetical protein